jgi:hypothetical protein
MRSINRLSHRGSVESKLIQIKYFLLIMARFHHLGRSNNFSPDCRKCSHHLKTGQSGIQMVIFGTQFFLNGKIGHLVFTIQKPDRFSDHST